MGIVSRFTARWLGRFKRLWAAFFSATGAASAPRFPFGGPDILDVGADGLVRVTKPAGPAPIRPRAVPNADFSSARTQRLARRAAAFLFDHYDFAAVPGQFWPFLERSFDPGEAMAAFLRAIGCNSDLVRRRDPEELRKAGEVIEFLVRSGDILHRLPPEMRRIVSLELESGNYDRIRELAETAAHLQAALDYASAWTGKRVVASFADLLRTIERMLGNLLTVAAADAAAAVNLVARFSEAQRRFDALKERYAALTAALRDAWPEVWRGTERETDLRKHTADFERVAESMRSSPDLTVDNLVEGNEFLVGRISDLEMLLDAARAGEAGTRKRSGPRGGRTKRPLDEKEVALRYFGFSVKAPPSSKQELQRAWRTKMKTLHPDAHPGATDEEIARLTEQCQECDRHYRMLLAYLSWR